MLWSNDKLSFSHAITASLELVHRRVDGRENIEYVLFHCFSYSEQTVTLEVLWSDKR